MILTQKDREWMEQQARVAGFDLAGLASVADSAESGQHAQRYAEWIAAGRAGEMDYLKREDDSGELLRGDLRRVMPWARSVLVCAFNYNTAAPLSIDPAPADTGWIARYAWSGRAEGTTRSDYHDVLLAKLRSVERTLKQRFGPSLESRCYVDTGPLVERNLAARAGVGWIGKNTCVLNQQQGSWLLLGVIVTSLELPQSAWVVPAADRCGSCTRCIDACPTDALIAPRQMDATRCISYLTIEKKGSIPEDLRGPMGRQVFGCDICQDVCPWNAKAPFSAASTPSPRAELINPALDWLASLEGPEFTRVFRGTPVERTRRQTSRRKLFRRNVAIAMGNSGDAGFLPRLKTWAATGDSVLAEAAAWAVERLQRKLDA
jgi:epoxyqueuosine reductase